MSFMLTWAFWGLLSVPAILALYLFKRRHRDLRVSALFLWRDPAAQSGGGRKLSKIENSLLMLLELLIAALLVCAAAGPGCRDKRSVNIVAAVLDNSASMSATPENSKDGSFKDRVAKSLEKYLEVKEPFQCTLVLTGRQPRLLGSALTSLKDVQEALKCWNPSSPPHQFDPSFALAFQIAGKEGHAVFLTDSKPKDNEAGNPDKPGNLEWIAVGEPAGNAAIVSASRKRNYALVKEEIVVSAANYGKSLGSFALSFYDGLSSKEPFLKRDLVLAPGAQEHVSIELPKMLDFPVRVALTPGGALKIDDSVILLPDSRPPVKVRRDFASPSLAELARRTIESLPGETVAASGPAHLLLTDKAPQPLDSASKDGSEHLWTMLFLSGEPKSAKTLFGPYILEKAHPLLEGVSLEGVRWAIPASSAQTPHDALPLISCGDFPLLAEGSLQGSMKSFVMSYVPERSNLHSTPSWPVMMHNLVRMRAAALPGFESRNCRAGEAARGSFPNGRMLELAPVSGGMGLPKVLPLAGASGAFEFISDETSLYDVKCDGRGEGMLSFNFLCADESNLGSCGKAAIKADSGFDAKGSVNLADWRDEAWLFLFAALALLVLRALLMKREEGKR